MKISVNIVNIYETDKPKSNKLPFGIIKFSFFIKDLYSLKQSFIIFNADININIIFINLKNESTSIIPNIILGKCTKNIY